MSEKKEYIERGAFIDFIDAGHLRYATEKVFSENDLVKMISERPAADVEPVVRARWENHFGEKICSACMGAAPIFANIRNHKYENCKQYETEFCPHCGAHMVERQCAMPFKPQSVEEEKKACADYFERAERSGSDE